jgi:hypothetical protein
MLYETEVPKLVVVDEAIELAKKYGSEHSGRFVNGLLDGLIKKHKFPGNAEVKQSARAARIAVHACASALLGFGAALAGAFASGALAQGTAVEGVDSARILAPAGTTIEPYGNLGYELKVEDGEVIVRSDAQPLRSVAAYRAPDFTDAERREPIVRLVSTLTRGAHTQFDAASRILGWVSREIRYTYDRSVSQEAAAVLARRSGYCTGVARLTVAMLRAGGPRSA